MREYTEVKLSSLEYELSDILEMKKGISIRLKDDPFSMPFLSGRPLEISKGNIVFETQWYYEGVTLDQINKGKQLELYEDFRKTKKIADGIIDERYFTKAKMTDWKIEEILVEDKSSRCIVDLEFSEEEKELLSYGNIPLRMEDKWFVYYQNDIIHFFRSWTGVEIFQAKFILSRNASWKILDLLVNTDEKFSGVNDPSLFTMLISSQLNRMKKLK